MLAAALATHVVGAAETAAASVLRATMTEDFIVSKTKYSSVLQQVITFLSR